MNRTMRTLSRTAGMALALSGAALFVAGQASANDRAVVVSCTDQSAGTWTVAMAPNCLVPLFATDVLARSTGYPGDTAQMLFLLVTTAVWVGSIDASTL